MSIVYYGRDLIDNIPQTIPLSDSAFTITGQWTFIDVIIKHMRLDDNLIVNGNAIINNGMTVNNTLTANDNVWVKGNLFVNTNSMSTDTVSGAGLVQNSGGNIYCGLMTGVAIAANWRDLAEKFEIDTPQPKGTIVMFGGEKEITIANRKNIPNGIIASDPALRMNQNAGDDETHPYMCWCGRVPCRVIGNIKKFDKLTISHIPGVATCRGIKSHEEIIGIALENYNSEEEGLIEVVTQAKLY